MSFACCLLGTSQQKLMDDADPEETLRQAYRRRMLSEHPDKGGSARGFLALSAAFELVRHALQGSTLKNDNTTRADDRVLAEHRRALLDHPVLELSALLALYLSCEATGRAPCIWVDMEVSLEEVYTGVVKRVNVPVWRSCRSPCHLTRFSKDLESLDGIDCDAGDWKYVGLFVPINADTVHDAEYLFEGMGHDSIFQSASIARGHIGVRINVEPHPVYTIDKVISCYDLHATVRVSMRDYYYGCSRLLPALAEGAPDLLVKYNPDTNTSKTADECRSVQVFKGLGLGLGGQDPGMDGEERGDERGDLYVFFDLVLPPIPQHVLSKPHVRLFFELIFTLLPSGH